MGRGSRWGWLAGSCALGVLGGSFLVAPVLPLPSLDNRSTTVVRHLIAGGFQALEAGPGIVAVRYRDHLVALHHDELGNLHILLTSDERADRVGLQAINAWNRDTSLVKVYSDDDGFVTFEASMLHGKTQPLQTVSDLLELFLVFVDDFLSTHAEEREALGLRNVPRNTSIYRL